MVKFTEFLIKRIGTKLDDVRNFENAADLNMAVDDIESYIDALKEIIIEVIKP